MTREATPWDYAELSASDPARGALLTSAPPAEQLAESVLARLEEAIRSDRIRFGMEESSTNRDHLRLTLQFHVGESLSDQFFNSATGYRAQFRLDWQRGLKYNNHIVERARAIVAALMPTTFLARRLTHEFNDCGAMTITRDQACSSMDPELSKVWFCGRLILGDGGVQQLQTGVMGPRLRLPGGKAWPAIARDESDAWLDIKGAFFGDDGIYQPKDPAERAKKLAAAGEA